MESSDNEDGRSSKPFINLNGSKLKRPHIPAALLCAL